MGKLKAPKGAMVIDGRGKTLIPGLWDMHGHLDDETDSFLTLAAGITTYRDLGNEARTDLWRQARLQTAIDTIRKASDRWMADKN